MHKLNLANHKINLTHGHKLFSFVITDWNNHLLTWLFIMQENLIQL